MADTKEKILMTALHLFASDGYEAVSVSRIAGELNMTKGALYKHYKSKRDIFDCIVERMFQSDTAQAEAYDVPADEDEDAPQEYEITSMQSIKGFTMAQFTFWTEDDFASHFRKMLTLEQYRNPEMAELYSNCIVAGPVSYMEDIFREMMKKGLFKEADPKQLAVEYYAPLFLLINMADATIDKEIAMQQLEAHIAHFVINNATEKLIME